MMIPFNVQESYKSQILSGQKTVEGRLNKGKFGSLKVGDLLQFDDTLEYLEVVNLTLYPSFQVMLEQEGLKHVLPGVLSVEEGVKVYYQFYTPEQERAFGVIAIQMKPK